MPELDDPLLKIEPRKPSAGIELFKKLYPKKDAHCAKCGSTEDLTIDHIRPKYYGGTDDLKNLRWLCYRCNQNRGADLSKRLQTNPKRSLRGK